MIRKVTEKLKISNNKNTAKKHLNYKTRNAITLIALVITIIILLILAGVTINLVVRRKRNT